MAIRERKELEVTETITPSSCAVSKTAALAEPLIPKYRPTRGKRNSEKLWFWVGGFHHGWTVGRPASESRSRFLHKAKQKAKRSDLSRMGLPGRRSGWLRGPSIGKRNFSAVRSTGFPQPPEANCPQRSEKKAYIGGESAPALKRAICSVFRKHAFFA